MSWQQFVINLGRLDPGTVEAFFEDHGALSVTLTDAGNKPVLEPAPGETPLWTDTRLTALFDANADLTGIADAMKQALQLATLPYYRVELLEDRDWEREWLRDFGPMRFGERLWVLPGDAAAPDGGVGVRLDPGLAFGTGTHPTTALCLEWLDGLELQDRTVLDYGCGSGILAIAAIRLGASEATAIDIDPQALTATRDNARQNGVGSSITVSDADPPAAARFDVVIANILAGPLVSLAESLSMRLSSGGELALSGILSGQVNKIRDAYGPWISFDAPAYRSQDDHAWARLTGKRRDR